MQGWSAELFGPLNARDYDDLHDPGTTEAAVARISTLAGAGRVLEFAIGTGRIALPLAAAGHDVSGIELAPEMIEVLGSKPGGKDIKVVQGDMSSARFEGDFDLVILVFNTLFNVTTQAGQVEVFRNAARHLRPGGRFLIEAFVPDLSRFRDGQYVGIKSMGLDHLALDAVQHNPLAQTLSSQRLWARAGETSLVPLVLRYAYPAELDLMAQLAGLRPVDRWGGWKEEAFAADSRMHVSLWEKSA